MTPSYQPESVIKHFDEFGVQEWERLVITPADEVSLYIHTYYLEKHITPRQKVLEIGAGAGRFTQIMADLDAEILVTDISGVQLDLNRKFSSEYGFDEAVIDWQQLDICDLSQFESKSFDAIVAYGGPFSYVLDKRDEALLECMRVLKPRGILLLSVMSLWGSAHGFLEGVLALPPEINQKITETGDITPATFPERRSNFMHLFRANELLEWLEDAGLRILDKSASNCISLTWNEKLKEMKNDPKKWDELLRMELEACADDGCLGLGTHIIVVAQKAYVHNPG
jgi:2-polyprenyl-3-methyl-5-hydroxy-6-metoxy-1,4-benzoquinol methylase